MSDNRPLGKGRVIGTNHVKFGGKSDPENASVNRVSPYAVGIENRSVVVKDGRLCVDGVKTIPITIPRSSVVNSHLVPPRPMPRNKTEA